MKKTLSILILFISLVSYSQYELKLAHPEIEPVVVEVEGMTADQLYNKAVNWVQETYKNPDKVLKAKIENEKIRVSGFASNAWFYKSMGIPNYYDMDYTIEVGFKDGRYRMVFTVGQFYANGATVMHQVKHFFKKDGSVKGTYSDAVPSLEKTMNGLAKSFYDYVSGKTESQEEDW